MAITQNILNLDAYFKSTPGDKIIINDLNYLNVNDIETINKMLITVYNNTDVISVKPQCDCGFYTGRYLLHKYCPKCGTACQEVNSKVYPIIWMRALHPSLRFLNPTFYMMLSRLLADDVDYIRWLTDDKYNPNTNKIQPHLIYIKEVIMENNRTYSTFCMNIPKIIHYLKTVKKYAHADKQRSLDNLLHMYNTQFDSIYTEYLPIVNKKLFVRENTNKGVFVNLVAADAMDIVMNWLKVSTTDKEDIYIKDKEGNEIVNPKVAKKWEVTTSLTLHKLATMYDKYMNEFVSQKSGIFRKHVYGGRGHFTFRNVITSIPGRHRHDELHVPWAIGPVVFRPHLLNKLINKHKFSYKDANKLLYRAVKRYDPLIDQLLNELIEESPDKKLPVLFQRNPSLKIGSSLKLGITKFKTDVEDKTVSLSFLSVKLGNGDFDGDELNGTVLLDNNLAQEAETFRPYKTSMDADKPYNVSRFISVLGPGNIILENYLSDKVTDGKQDKIFSKLKKTKVKVS